MRAKSFIPASVVLLLIAARSAAPSGSNALRVTAVDSIGMTVADMDLLRVGRSRPWRGIVQRADDDD